jgi:phage shock protein PspC (stress-responsive transcriptional regulator)
MKKRLYKSRTNRVIGGVCGGVGEYFDIDPVVVRILWLVALLVLGTGLLAYIICLIVIPDNPK